MDKQFRKKLDPKAVKMILVGYQNESKNYQIYSLKINKVTVSRNVIFNEKSQNKIDEQGKDPLEDLSYQNEDEVPTNEVSEDESSDNKESIQEVHNNEPMKDITNNLQFRVSDCGLEMPFDLQNGMRLTIRSIIRLTLIKKP